MYVYSQLNNKFQLAIIAFPANSIMPVLAIHLFRDSMFCFVVNLLV